MDVTRRSDTVPGLGDYLDYRRNRLDFWTDTGELGPLVRVRFGRQEFWVVTDPDIAEHILLKAVKDYPRDRRLMALNRGPGPELMFNTDRWEEWRRRRRLLAPGFRREAVEGFGPTIVRHARRKADELAGVIDVQAEMREMTMRIILETMFSVTADHDVARLQRTFEYASDVVAARASAPVTVPYWLPTPANIRLLRLMRYRSSTLGKIISDRVRTAQPQGDLLDLLILHHVDNDERGLTTRELIGEMSGIVFAGHETTAETQAWLLHLVSTHPHVEAGLRSEFESVLGDRDPTVQDLHNMPYTERVILETMRLYPAVYLTIREADVDHTVAGYDIPAGTRLVINIRGLQRDPFAWPDPDTFDPDRFCDDDGRHRFQYIPFLAGPKKCLGDHFAMLEMRLTIPTLLQRLRFYPATDKPPEPHAGFTLSVDGGLPMRAHQLGI
ncbi:MAG: cytochrome P450 [Acidimicrobiia bacterium]|nr:cytochrome P450 [Acidimicrobiia bacterium]